MSIRVLAVILLTSLVVMPAAAQSSRTSASWAATLANDVRVAPDITYLTANNWQATLDVYTPAGPGPHPTILHIHGGGWTGGSKESVVVARVSEAPAAVEDCRCALRWVIRNAKDYGFDVNRIVAMGYSAGGHLALTTGMLPASTDLDRVSGHGGDDCGSDRQLVWHRRCRRPARRPQHAQLRRAVAGQPARSPTVPYSHATRLQAALAQAGATSELVTILGGKHGGFPATQQVLAVDAVRAFLVKHGLMPRSSDH